MFKMMRSAGSCLNWEPGMDSTAAVSRKQSGSACSGCAHGSLQPATDSTLKRLRTVPRPRASRAKPVEKSENTCPPTSVTATSNPAALGDVTNKMQGSGGTFTTKADQPPLVKATAMPSRSAGNATDMVDVDKAHADNAEYAVEYMSDIFTNLRVSEKVHAPRAGFLDGQTHVNSKMRAILVDWLVDVHRKYKMQSTTLFLGISIIDRFLEKKDILRKNLQLVGVTSLFIAAKYEEVYPPKITDFVYVTDKAYSKNDIISMELRILAALDFQICTPISINFLERYQQVNGCSETHCSLSQYVLELTLPESKMVKFAPSHVAAAASFLSNKLLQKRPAWPHAAVSQTGMTEDMIRDCAREMCNLLENSEGSQLQAVRKKFLQVKHHSVAKLNFGAGAQTATVLNFCCEDHSSACNASLSVEV